MLALNPLHFPALFVRQSSHACSVEKPNFSLYWIPLTPSAWVLVNLPGAGRNVHSSEQGRAGSAVHALFGFLSVVSTTLIWVHWLDGGEEWGYGLERWSVREKIFYGIIDLKLQRAYEISPASGLLYIMSCRFLLTYPWMESNQLCTFNTVGPILIWKWGLCVIIITGGLFFTNSWF